MKLSAKDEKKIREMTDAAIVRFIDSIPDKVNTILTKVVCSLLGVKSGWSHGDYEVDHTNGRETILTRLLQRRCHAQVEAAFEPIINHALKNLAKDKKFWAAIAKDVARSFTETINYKLRNKATEWAETEANKVIANLENTKLKPLFRDPLDLEDPKGCETQVEDLLMEEFAKTMAAIIDPSPE